MLRKGVLWFVYAILIPVTCVFAEVEEQSSSTSGHEDHVNIFAGDLGTAVWTLLLFIILLLILKKWAWGPILSSLQKREDYIRRSIEDAEKSREEAQQALDEYQRQLSQARLEAKAIMEEGRQDAIQLAGEFKHQAETEAHKIRQQAQRDIALAKNQALRDIFQQSSELATDMAARIIGKTLNPDDHRALLQESINRLQQETSKK
ncbi:MAG: F0F1 ATP synthase subunit B [Sedimentisphaerales bacterium]|nr:F0F1 ATP synthase subunit B [Sedimentisphaerales bacterium]